MIKIVSLRLYIYLKIQVLSNKNKYTYFRGVNHHVLNFIRKTKLYFTNMRLGKCVFKYSQELEVFRFFINIIEVIFFIASFYRILKNIACFFLILHNYLIDGQKDTHI